MADVSFPVLVSPAIAKERRPLLAGNAFLRYSSTVCRANGFHCEDANLLSPWEIRSRVLRESFK